MSTKSLTLALKENKRSSITPVARNIVAKRSISNKKCVIKKIMKRNRTKSRQIKNNIY